MAAFSSSFASVRMLGVTSCACTMCATQSRLECRRSRLQAAGRKRLHPSAAIAAAADLHAAAPVPHAQPGHHVRHHSCKIVLAPFRIDDVPERHAAVLPALRHWTGRCSRRPSSNSRPQVQHRTVSKIKAWQAFMRMSVAQRPMSNICMECCTRGWDRCSSQPSNQSCRLLTVWMAAGSDPKHR